MPRTKEQILQRMNEIGITKRVCIGKCNIRALEDGAIDEENRRISFTLISKENAGERYDWWNDEIYIEELDVNGANTETLRTFFKDHRPSVDNAIGRVENKRVEDGELKADVVFGRDDESQKVFQKYLDGVLTDVSIGYRVNDIMVTERKDEPTHVLVTDYDIVELSAVWKGFDPGASISRSLTNKEPEMANDSRNIELLERELNLKEKTL